MVLLSQRRWKDLTDREKEELAAREQKRLAIAAGTGSSSSSVRAELSGYFTVRDQPSVENGQGSASSFAAASSESTNMKDQDPGQGKQATSCSDGAADSDKPKSLLSAQRRSAMLAELGTNASLLRTPDVLGRGDFLAVLDAAVEAWTKHKQFLAVYDRQKKWFWKQRSIKQGEAKLEKETLQLKAKLSVVCSLTVDATTTLTVTGMRTALEKSSQLVELTALLVRFKKEVEEQERLLHRRISQLTHQQSPTASKFFWTALNPP